MRIALVILILSLLFPLVAPPAQGGSEQSPEIADGTNDVDLGHGRTTIGAPEIDLTAVWFSSNATTITVSWEVVNISHELMHNEGRSFWVGCTSAGGPVSIFAWIFPNSAWGESDTPGHVSVAPLLIRGNTMTVSFDRGLMPGSSCVNTLANGFLMQQISPGSWSSSNIWGDYAPDTGYGQDAQFS